MACPWGVEAKLVVLDSQHYASGPDPNRIKALGRAHEWFGQIVRGQHDGVGAIARVERLEDVPEVMAKAFHIARSGRPGPVHVELPRLTDYSEYILQEERAVLPPYERIAPVLRSPAASDVERFAKRLEAAGSVVIAAGKGVMRRRAMRELADLSLKLQAPVVSAQDAIGVIPEDHPFFAGYFARNRAHPLSAQALEDAEQRRTAELAANREYFDRHVRLVYGGGARNNAELFLPVCSSAGNWSWGRRPAYDEIEDTFFRADGTSFPVEFCASPMRASAFSKPALIRGALLVLLRNG